MAAHGAGDKDKFLIFGHRGWLGGVLVKLCKDSGLQYEVASSRLEDRTGVERELDTFKPTHVLNCAGVTGRPNVDWCEDHRIETIRSNVIGTLTLADTTCVRNIHMTNFGTGCIFEYDEAHPMPPVGVRFSGTGFKEEDKGNFAKSYYSKTKGVVEDLLNEYPNVLNLRVRMPISEDLEFGRNFVYKIAHYEKVVNIPNSMTVIPELMPFALRMAQMKTTGNMNFTNPGVVSHNEILELYREYYKPGFTYQNFSLDEQADVVRAGRSNNELDSTRLKSLFPEMLDIRSSLVKYVFEPARAVTQTPSRSAL
mmetsp:Transcript_27775/g.78616  ORF Transcript_27775/g.78616 Transcript_27775/m.78616 type:complete len:310 (+) Transcript_27775:97-1026(+)|eukprot:CAMPEP_0179245038 /NCGR_PEP_ID=MMETSP0797-20121207/18366_1 /TAXON_ID=47934 /ORGANISM="Dinophysis acuminata, Strain DAEP01" /LENGTH=309 /DNA_ID=CAMNT_0020952571 /DNA_START=92 /DNA_END=1021 /DNA_ORIENTATION=+